ncbi:HAD hydrolase-like protein [Streptomyces actuosus]|uniref:HAD hydrolase-like protein n=1 Tax=Streptomyces actuosus TaxID=1885 RepID=A0ABS2VPT1_STRAS|nr:HAD hydrolase-like protein [Streptomyces actuosus]
MTRESEGLRALVAGARHVLFDFDGPICLLFHGCPADRIAAEQVEWLDERGLGWVLTDSERRSEDPHGVLSSIAERHPGSDLVAELEEQLTRHELRAARRARPTAHADVLIRTWVAVGVQLAIVTNNSARTVSSYLRGRGLLRCFDPHIYGRTRDLSLLKPHPRTLNTALTALGAAPETSLMIGDSLSDHTAAVRAGVPFVGYARHDATAEQMQRAGVPEHSITRSLEPLLEAVRRS